MSNQSNDQKARKRLKPQPLDWYLSKAKALAPIIPSIKKHRLDKRKAKLKPWEKGLIRKFARITAYENRLIPVTAAQAKKLKDSLFAPGVRAIKLDNTGHITGLKIIKRDMFLTTNGRVWLYWRLSDFTTAGMARAGQQAFGISKKRRADEDDEYADDLEAIQSAFPIEQIAILAERAFKHPKAKAVHLWTVNGRVGEPFETLNSFMFWLAQEWRHYDQQEKWVRGLAIRLSD